MLKAIGALCLALLLTLLRAVMIADLWRWFVVPNFNLPSLGIMAIAGILLLISLLTPTKRDKGIKMDDLAEDALVAVGCWLIIWGFAALIHALP